MNRFLLLLFGAVTFVAHSQVPDYVPTEGLVAWYPLDGDGLDIGPLGLQGTTLGTECGADRFALSCGAVTFTDGDRIVIETDSSHSSSELTVCFWTKLDNHQSYNHFFNRWEGSDYEFVMSSNSTGLYIYVGNTLFLSDHLPSLNEWHQLTFWYSFATGSAGILEDGVSVAEFTGVPETPATNYPMHIGGTPDGSGYNSVNGEMDDLGLWNRILTEEEILALYNAPAPTPGCTDPTACNFDSEANQDDGSCLSTSELSLQNQIRVDSEGQLVLTAPESLQNWTWDNGTSDPSVQIGSGGSFSIQGVIGGIPEIGSELNEGLVFAIDSSNQIVYIASPEEIGTGSEWGCYGTSTGATGQGMGDGLTNTQLILENCSDENSAAAVASEYGENWYLPSFEELDAIRTQLHDNGFGDYSMDNPLSYNWYWSSTECSENPNWAAGSMHFSDGFYGACNNKNSNPGGVIAAKMVQGAFCLFTDTITIQLDCSLSNDLSATEAACGPGTYWDEFEFLCLPITTCQEDLDGDGVIGVNDLMQLLSSFGTDCPEPGDPETAEWTCGDPVSYLGYDYATVQIGEQCWFAENLRSEFYQNGDSIPAYLSDSEWNSTFSGATAVYGESEGCNNFSPDGDACDIDWSLNEFGRLYNKFAVNDDRGLCPNGWHVPADEEWMTLEIELGMTEGQAMADGYRGSDQGSQMKSTYGWYSAGNGSDTSGLSCLPGGTRMSNGYFVNAGKYGSWWCSGNMSFWQRTLNFEMTGVFRNNNNNGRTGCSIRCIQDAP